nr:MAG TPA: hypothetical protein [Bacteriophage sp.]DAY27352.1 MAG TPA: hypothetical protein [Caudoviricetes sp.]
MTFIIAITVRKANEDTMMFSGDSCEDMYFSFPPILEISISSMFSVV